MKMRLTEGVERMLESAEEEPFLSFNRRNGITTDAFLDIIKEIDAFILQFEREIGMKGASKWIGERLDEAVKACLLYTSPSPRDGLLSRMPSSA